MTARACWMAALLTLATVPGGAVAQRSGSLEVGGFGRYTRFADSLRLDDAFGGGGHLGVFLLPWLALEGSAAYTPTNTAGTAAGVRHLPIVGRLTVHVPAGARVSFLLGAGYLHSLYDAAAGGSAGDHGVQGLAGFRLWLAGGLGIRAEGVAELTPSQAGVTERLLTFGAQLGLAVVTGRAPRDADGDGVPDREDSCPGTPAVAQTDIAGCPRDGDRDHVPDYRDRCPSSPAGVGVDAEGCPVDGDGDGVFDGLDRCANTPAGVRVNPEGCPTDADRDGVLDGIDQCADTPADAPVDPRGCPLDGDGDGVIDLHDQCARTPAGATIDPRGCPLDTDGDRVVDGLDRCPNTPAGRQVDANGCPILFEESRPTLVLRGVTFRSGSAELTGDSRTVLDIVAQSLLGNPGVRVEVGGHTDNTGGRALNVRLSLARAEAVRSHLIARGVPAERLTARGYGPDHPVADNGTAAGRAENRRVELRRLE